AGFGLLDYNARYYNPLVGRFVAADTVVPDYQNPQKLNRYSYVRNNPLKYIDPTGHADVCGITAEDCGSPVSGEVIVGIHRSKQWREEAFAPVVEYIDAIKEAY
ncbi:MAG: RHS repeat-associated core domain-containing protein, partial [Phycisphaerae bacterium]|nr:RHS repeat-associated core domain-containing protein [Phycisphaerae bacterium]NIW47987.1 hypothetical protein [Gammaproteobacteria bacterium]NIX02545.1 hypothetical protein [Phycisphaerae bacterium]NIX32139.1 hypothetical protein [Phycisphaerae bacterium]